MFNSFKKTTLENFDSNGSEAIEHRRTLLLEDLSIKYLKNDMTLPRYRVVTEALGPTVLEDDNGNVIRV